MSVTHPFTNHPLSDFSIPAVRQNLASALQSFEQDRSAQRFHAAPIIGGAEEKSGELFIRTDPSDTSLQIGSTYFATLEQAERALTVCAAGFPKWRARSAEERASIIEKAGLLIRDRAAFFTSLLIREAGKPWRDSDADVAEAIDFCLFYAEEMRRLGTPQLTERVLGEENYYLYQPRGVVAVISPWNFPLAIACGMVVAALVTGNTVIFKPSEQTNIVAYELAKLLYAAGVPADALAFLPGRGEVIGRHLVESPKTAMIVFTGSRPVGLEIIKSAAQVVPGQAGIKRVVAELGGKNAIIVDEDADFDDAIRGVVTSAFGFAGQKCSACSRVIIVGSAYEAFITRLAAATADLQVGPTSHPANLYGPVIDEEAYNRIMGLLQSCTDVPLLIQGSLAPELQGRGWYIPPTIFRDVPTNHTLWRDEIFGPVVACVPARSFQHALELANDSEYELTGGIFSRNPSNIESARAEFRVGNLYINRGITGSLVCRQPFGGFKFSGIGSKAGGKDYLLQFLEPRTITENTMRRGFTPDLNS
jgi:RHH-type proline utilization regulon transcriptional repressor/proline dehydrogenase/delta 1-pyrroline-5-carboxylate dehydrogenase